MGRVNDLVRIGGVMNRRDLSMSNTDRLLDHFDYGCKTIGRARCGRHDLVLCGIVQMIVHAHHNI